MHDIISSDRDSVTVETGHKDKVNKKKHQPETFHFPECSLTEHPLEFSFNLGIFAPCLFRTLCRSVHFHETDVANEEDMPLWLLLFSTLSLSLSLSLYPYCISFNLIQRCFHFVVFSFIHQICLQLLYHLGLLYQRIQNFWHWHKITRTFKKHHPSAWCSI